MDKKTIAFLMGRSEEFPEDGQFFDEETTRDRFVWTDPKGYEKLRRALLPIAAVALLAGMIPYVAWMRSYTDGFWWASALGVLVALALLLIFRKRIGNSTAAYVRYEGLFYRLSAVNRAITIVAEDNEAEWPDFRRDFRRAKKGDSCWRILKVYGVEKRKKYFLVNCKICKSKSGKEQLKAIRVGEGYLNMDTLLEQFEGLKEAEQSAENKI